MIRCADLMRFYGLLGRLSDVVGGARALSSLRNYSDWPRLGVYFFFEPGEVRQDSGEGPRVVRVGTHALASGPSPPCCSVSDNIAGKPLEAAIIAARSSGCSWAKPYSRRGTTTRAHRGGRRAQLEEREPH
jgi:hypothetical protein